MNKKNPVVGFLLSPLPMLAGIAALYVMQIIAVFVCSAVIFATGAISLNEVTDFQDIIMQEPFYSAIDVTGRLGMLIVGFFWYRVYRYSENGFRTLSLKMLIGCFAVGIAVQGIMMWGMTFAFWVLPESVYESYAELTEALVNDPSWLTVLSVAVLAPISEELLFRGITLKILATHNIPKTGVVIVQAVWFGVFHMLGTFSYGTAVQAVYTSLFAIVLGLFAIRFNSVVPSILIHMALNGGALLLSFFESLTDNPEIVQYAMIPISVLLIALALFINTKIPAMPAPVRFKKDEQGTEPQSF